MTDPDQRRDLLDRITEIALGDPVDLTRDEAVAAAGMSIEQARPYWRAMGFADVEDGPAFTAGDVSNLRQLAAWADSGLVDPEVSLDVVRSIGQTASRLADWQADSLMRLLAETDAPVDLAGVADGLSEVIPGLERMLAHAWRRHFAVALARGLALVDEGSDGFEPSFGTVGFADIAGFTRLARSMSDEDLAVMVQAFETGAADIVASHGARLVKTLGDEVLFVSADADAGVALAIEMHHLVTPGPERLRLRIGLATGRMIARMGDVYGGTVNRASRLTGIARPGGTLVDAATEDALRDPEPYVLRHQAPRRLRGMGLVRATSVSRRRS